MKKILAFLLAFMMIVSCAAGMTFTTAAEEASGEYKLYGGEATANVAFNSGDAATKTAQRFVVPAGEALKTISIKTTNANSSNGTLRLYKWNCDYATTVAATPVFENTFKAPNGGWTTFTLETPVTGVLLWEFESLGGSYQPRLAGASELKGGVTLYKNGNVVSNANKNTTGKGEETGTEGLPSMSFAAKYTTVASDSELRLYTGEATDNVAFFGGDKAVKSGQKFSVPAGKLMNSISLKTANTNGSSATLNIYKWMGDYATTVASAALYTTTFKAPNQTWINFDLTTSLSGDLFWEMTASDTTNYQPRIVGASVGAADGVTNYMVNASGTVSNSGSNSGSTGNGEETGNASVANKTFAAKIGVVEDPDYVAPVDLKLYDGEATANVAFNSSDAATKSGQKFTVPAGKLADSVSVKTHNSNSSNATFRLYQWKGDYASTVAATPIVEKTFVAPNNGWTTFTLATPAGGELFWELESLGTSYQPRVAGASALAGGVDLYKNGAKVANANFNNKGVGEETKTADLPSISLAAKVSLVHDSAYPDAVPVGSYNSLFTGEALDANAFFNAKNAKKFGEIFTVATGKQAEAMSLRFQWYKDTNCNATFRLYQWTGDYATTVAAAPLYEEAFTVTVHKAWINFTFDAPATGELFWEVDCGDANYPRISGASGKDSNVTLVINGQLNATVSTGNGTTVTGTSYAVETVAARVLINDAPNVYINSISKEVLYSGYKAYGTLSDAKKAEFDAAANKYAVGDYRAFNGKFDRIVTNGTVAFYTQHTYADTVSVNGEAMAMEGDNVTVSTSPVGFIGWKNAAGIYIANSATVKWYPQSASDTLTAVYEGEAMTSDATANAERNGDTLTVTVTPSFVDGEAVVEYGYYISIGTAIDTNALDGVTKVTAKDAYSAYLTRVYDVSAESVGKTVYVVPYIVTSAGTVYGDAVQA